MPKVTPRDWQAMAQIEAARLLGTPEAAAKLAEARRYEALALEIERLRDLLSECQAAPSARPLEWYESEAQRFFEWPEGSKRDTVTLFSAMLFARHCAAAQMAPAAEGVE